MLYDIKTKEWLARDKPQSDTNPLEETLTKSHRRRDATRIYKKEKRTARPKETRRSRKFIITWRVEFFFESKHCMFVSSLDAGGGDIQLWAGPAQMQKNDFIRKSR